MRNVITLSTRVVERLAVGGLLGLVLSFPAGQAVAQEEPQPEQTPEAIAEPSPREIQRWFDAYVLMQAQEALELSDTQYPQFMQRMRALQETRRRNHAARHAALMELHRLTAKTVSNPDEGLLRDRLRALLELDARSVVEARKAYEAVDQILTIPQQARFRVFEEQVERRKLQLLLRARHGARANRPARPLKRPSQ